MGRILTATLIVMGLAGLGLVAWVSLHDSSPAPAAPAIVAQAPTPTPPPAPVPQRMVLVAATPLRAGNLIKPADIDEKSFPVSQIPAGASDSTPQTRSSLFGAMIRRSLAPGEVIMPADVMHAGDHGFLAAVLEPGKRAVTLGADALSSDLDLVFPGDRVDAILIQQADPGPGVSAAKRVFGNTVLSDARVLAVDQQMLDGSSADKSAPKARSVTLEVTPAQATELAVATRLGKLSLSVRSSDRTKTDAGPGASTVTYAGDVSPALAKGTAPPPPRVVRVWQGSGDGKEYQY